MENDFVYEMALRKFLQNNKLKNEVDFLNGELKILEKKINEIENISEHQIRSEILKEQPYYNDPISEENKQDRDESLKYFISLRTRVYEEKINFNWNLLENYKLKLSRLPIPKNEEINLDLSGSKGTEKIIYLKQLGIIDFLREKEPFKNSTNKLATAISAITGIPQQTAQSYLNPIVSTGTEQKNNPLNSIIKVEKIKQTLINLGFKPQE